MQLRVTLRVLLACLSQSVRETDRRLHQNPVEGRTHEHIREVLEGLLG